MTAATPQSVSIIPLHELQVASCVLKDSPARGVGHRRRTPVVAVGGAELAVSVPGASGWIKLPYGLAPVGQPRETGPGILNKVVAHKTKIPLPADVSAKLSELDSEVAQRLRQLPGLEQSIWSPSVKEDRGGGHFVNVKLVVESSYEQPTSFKILGAKGAFSSGAGSHFFEEHVANNSFLRDADCKLVLQPKVYIMESGQAGLYFVATHAAVMPCESSRASDIDAIFPDEALQRDADSARRVRARLA